MEIREFTQPNAGEEKEIGVRERLLKGALEELLKKKPEIDQEEAKKMIEKVMRDKSLIIDNFLAESENATSAGDDEKETAEYIVKKILENQPEENLDQAA